MPGSAHYPNLKTINDIFFSVAARVEAPAMLWRNAQNAWTPLRGSDIYGAVADLTRSFLRLGIVKGDRICLLAENRWEWAVTDFAALAMGAISVPIYPTLTAEQTGNLIANSGSRIAVVSTRKQYEKVAGVRDRTRLEHIVVMDNESLPDSLSFQGLLGLPGDKDARADRAFEQQARDIQPHDLATIIYTSGTTGEPKGVMLTHGNLASNVNFSSHAFDFGVGDTCISFLPLSHITARHLDYLLLARGAVLAYCPFFEQLPAAMASVRPTVFVAVPRVYEKIMQEVKRRAARSPVKARTLSFAAGIGRRHRGSIIAGREPRSPLWKLARKIVFAKIRQVFGGRVRYFISGGAPLGIDTAEWFADVGIQMLEGFGLTETSPVLALNSQSENRIGSVGKPIPHVYLRFAEDGELLVRGPYVFQGYWNDLDATREAFEVDASGDASPAGRWFKTGDIGHLDENGFLFITERKKELIKTSGGKFIAPQSIENKLKVDRLVGSAALVGDRHKFACALISPNLAALDEWASAHGVPTTPRAELVAHPEVRALYHRIVHAANAHLANFEKVKRFHIVPEEWSIETGELTPSMKLKRRVVLERYAAEIDRFYKDEAVSHG
jgi:long-chain acyl-CoA synthetase